MADDDNPFAQFGPAPLSRADAQAGITVDQPDDSDNPFSQFGPRPVAPQQSALGAAARSALPSVAPAAAGLAAAGVGAAIGSLIGPEGSLIGGVGGFVGGALGFFGGSAATEVAQNYALSKAPDSWVDALGQSDRQQRLDQEQHTYASMLGGLAPYAITMSPTASAKIAGELAENAGPIQRVMANPVTSRIFGGLAVGGMEAGQEKLHGDVSYAKVGIATGFGFLLNRPNKLGEAIENFGAAPFRRAPAPRPPAAPPLEEREAIIPQPEDEGDFWSKLHEALTSPPARAEDILGGVAPRIGYAPPLRGLGTEEGAFLSAGHGEGQAEAPPDLELDAFARLHDSLTERQYDDYDILGLVAPTFIQGEDVGTIGAGITEETFMGDEDRNPDAQHAARVLAQDEHDFIGPRIPNPDVLARKTEPEAFSRFDDLLAQQSTFRKQIADWTSPEGIEAARQRITALQAQLAAHLETTNGYAGGPEARRLRANIRAAEMEVEQRSQRVETEHIAQIRAQLLATDHALMDAGREVAAARRRAADALRAGTVAPEPIPEPRMAEAPAPPVVPPPEPAPIAAVSPTPAIEPEPAPKGRGKTKAPEPVAAPVAETPTTSTTPEPAPVAPPAVEVPAPAPQPVAPPAPRTIEQQRGFIEDDIRRKLIAAGRPAHEVEGEAKIVSALYETHAADLGNLTPEELYRREPVNVKLSERLKNAFGKLTPEGIIRLARDAHAGTFIHELMHDWLNRILRDGESENAPAALKERAASIRRWAGSKEGPLTAKQHDKVAYAFERYLHDGIAPSPRLARVFGQFRNWLVDVYRSIKEARKPEEISDDIRGVFDRMLTTEPNRTVIAPERPIDLQPHELHAIDAARTEPADAAIAADRVAAERAAHLENPPPEIAHEIAQAETEAEQNFDFSAGAKAYGHTGEPGGEIGVGDQRLQQVEPSRSGPKPEPGGVGVGAGGGKERAGGNAIAPKGGGLSRGSDDTTRGGGPKSQPLAPSPAESFPDNGSFDVSRDGVIRTENMTSVPRFVEALNEAAERLNLGNGPITMGQMLDVAGTFNLRPGEITAEHLERMFGGMKNMEAKVQALRRALMDQLALVTNLADKFSRTNGEEDGAKLATEMARHDMMFSVLTSVRTSSGRTTGMAFRNMEEWDKSFAFNDISRAMVGRDLFQLKKMAKLIKSLDTPGKLSKYLRDAQKRTFGKGLLEYWVNALISGLQTHVTYVLGLTASLVNKIGPETAIAAGLGTLHGGERVYIGEVPENFKALGRALPRAFQASLEGMRTGMTTLLPGELARPLHPLVGDTLPAQGVIARTSTNQDVSWSEVRADLFGMIRGMRDGVLANGKLLAAGGDPNASNVGVRYVPGQQIPNVTLRGVTVPTGYLATAPSRAVASFHSFFRVMNYAIENNAKAWRQATAEGLTGTAHTQRVADLRQNPSEKSMLESRGVADQQTLMQNGSEFLNRLTRLADTEFQVPVLGATPLIRFVLPFIKIAANIVDQSLVQRTPLGLLAPELRADLLGRNGNIARDTAAARMIAGSAMAMVFGGLAAEGYVTGSGPSDPNKAAMWRQAGYSSHSVRIGDTWYDLHRLGPVGMLLGVAADMHDVAHSAFNEDFLHSAAVFQHALTQNMLDESFMRGVADLIQAMDDPGRYGDRYVRNFISSFVPYSVGMGYIDRATDPYARQARTVVDAMKAKVPGLSEGLFPRRDIWGEPIPNRTAFIGAGVTAIYASKMSQDPVNRALAQLGIGKPPVSRTIMNVKLTDQQYDDFARIAGKLTKMRLDTVVQSPDWQAMPPHSKHDVVDAIFKYCRNIAREQMKRMYPSIPAEATRNKFVKRQQEDEDTE